MSCGERYRREEADAVYHEVRVVDAFKACDRVDIFPHVDAPISARGS